MAPQLFLELLPKQVMEKGVRLFKNVKKKTTGKEKPKMASYDSTILRWMHTLFEDLLCDARGVEWRITTWILNLGYNLHCHWHPWTNQQKYPFMVFFYIFFQVTSCSYFSLVKRHLPCPAGVSCEHTLTGLLPSMATGSLPVCMHKPVSHSMCSCNRAHLLGKISISKVATEADSSLCVCVHVCACTCVSLSWRIFITAESGSHVSPLNCLEMLNC